ncbi:hypothetical protein [Antribacter gilvus]|uniref:hypothetical protein n=1 Tax=Antribacter gilvus TaxID=2304675 RepID=UPI000F769C74|nr:hypothetical protein [Antribacter gilvus]
MDHHIAQFAGVRALLLEWDAIGVADISHDEYDCMAGPLLRHLYDGRDAGFLRDVIVHERESHFRLSPDEDADRTLADALVAWWRGAMIEGDRS